MRKLFGVLGVAVVGATLAAPPAPARTETRLCGSASVVSETTLRFGLPLPCAAVRVAPSAEEAADRPRGVSPSCECGKTSRHETRT